MAGIGVDAMIMDETDEDLKDKVGTAAYFVAAREGSGPAARADDGPTGHQPSGPTSRDALCDRQRWHPSGQPHLDTWRQPR
jgi:hypothetical protein